MRALPAHADSAGGVQLLALVGQLISLRRSKKTLQIFLDQVNLSTSARRSRASSSPVILSFIKFAGDIEIQELSAKFFAGLGATVAEFHRLFQQRQHFERVEAGSGGFVSNPAGLSSYLIRCRELLSTYNSIFHRQVFQSECTFSKLGKCLRHAFHHCQLLETRHAGLNLSFVLSKMFTPSLVDVITKNYKHVESLIHEELHVESWRVTELRVQEKERDKGDAGGTGRRRRADSTRNADLPNDDVNNDHASLNDDANQTKSWSTPPCAAVPTPSGPAAGTANESERERDARGGTRIGQSTHCSRWPVNFGDHVALNPGASSTSRPGRTAPEMRLFHTAQETRLHPEPCIRLDTSGCSSCCPNRGSLRISRLVVMACCRWTRIALSLYISTR